MVFERPPDPLHNFTAPAAPSAAAWRVLCGLLLLLALLILGGMGIGAASLALGVAQSKAEAFALFETPISALILLATFLIWRPALWLTLKVLHRRSLSTLFSASGRVDWRAFRNGMLIAGGFIIVTTLAGIVLVGVPIWTGGAFGPWAVFAVIAVPLIYYQTSAEELLFRGYLLQQLSARFGAFWAWGLVPSICFGLLHWNPDGYAATAGVVLLITGLIGLIFALATAATGNLGLAMGLHFGFNIFALLLIAPNKAFSALALMHWPEEDGDLMVLLVVELASLAVMLAAAAAIYRRSRRSA